MQHSNVVSRTGSKAAITWTCRTQNQLSAADCVESRSNSYVKLVKNGLPAGSSGDVDQCKLPHSGHDLLVTRGPSLYCVAPSLLSEELLAREKVQQPFRRLLRTRAPASRQAVLAPAGLPTLQVHISPTKVGSRRRVPGQACLQMTKNAPAPPRGSINVSARSTWYCLTARQ